jgi:hypothetical protein
MCTYRLSILHLHGAMSVCVSTALHILHVLIGLVIVVGIPTNLVSAIRNKSMLSWLEYKVFVFLYSVVLWRLKLCESCL